MFTATWCLHWTFKWALQTDQVQSQTCLPFPRHYQPPSKALYLSWSIIYTVAQIQTLGVILRFFSFSHTPEPTPVVSITTDNTISVFPFHISRQDYSNTFLINGFHFTVVQLILHLSLVNSGPSRAATGLSKGVREQDRCDLVGPIMIKRCCPLG